MKLTIAHAQPMATVFSEFGAVTATVFLNQVCCYHYITNKGYPDIGAYEQREIFAAMMEAAQEELGKVLMGRDIVTAMHGI